ncbi:MAG: hypothetical protein Q8R67_05145 [Rhodoferax sp.]|nr:hypothetical protein [Rhodoferax sp.]MDP3651052.1 hypothetical protein [Rhodoferax sp.]
MASAPFAALESRVNNAVFARLSNAVATVNGVTASAIFDNGYSAGNLGGMAMASTQPTLALETADVPASPVGLSAVVGGVSYTIAEHQPDGTGVSTLFLERVL